ncbi:MAG: phytanoyl-CoA dioxygenase family protein [Ignavibacteriales bacterium]|nr:phytanoyl-CoA dioxygenase family protein [Ignavibacteriales bacterium]
MNQSFSTTYSLSQNQVGQYQRDGHILLENVASKDEVDAVRPLIVGIVDETAKAGETQGRISDYSKMFTQITNVWRRDASIKEFIHARRFAHIAADLMGVKGVRLYHDQALVKEPGGKPTPWHQDYYYWPLATEHTITMWMPLVDVTREMGSMSFVQGSHVDSAFEQLPISATSQEYFERVIKNLRKICSYSLIAGDATFHSGRALHAAHANASNRRREVIAIIYYADGTRIPEPDNQHRKVDMEVFHPGQKPGELAASELNPLLFSRL